MSVINLNFTRPFVAVVATAVALNFGLSAVAVAPMAGELRMVSPAPGMKMRAVYDSGLPQFVVGQAAAPWQPGIAAERTRITDWSQAINFRKQTEQPWVLGAQAACAVAVGHGDTGRLRAAPQVAWALALRTDTGRIEGGFGQLLPSPVASAVFWQLGSAVLQSSQLQHKQLLPAPVAKVLRWQVAAALQGDVALVAGTGLPMIWYRDIPWQLGAQPSGLRRPVVPPIEPPVVSKLANLNFNCPWVFAAPNAVFLNFGHFCPVNAPALLAVLPASFYMTINTVQAVLLPSLAEVPLYAGATVSQDVGSYGWTLSATGPDSLFDQLKPLPGQPKQIRVTINGIDWVFAVDPPSKSHVFGKKVTQITGRSVTAALGPAFALETARMNTAPFTAQQLAAQALDNTAITLDWGIDDWLVPAGAWSHYGTPLAAVQAIAQAAGGHVQSARSAPVLQVRHPYPLLPGGVLGGPWNWNGAFAADVSLSPDAIIERFEELRDSPAINAVYVSGTSQGVLALVKREGTAGDLLGAQVTDALITANMAAQQRGLAVLGAAGGRIMRRLELPILVGAGQPGVLSTDQLIEVADSTPWRGRVRAVTVTANRPSVRQSVLVEVS